MNNETPIEQVKINNDAPAPDESATLRDELAAMSDKYLRAAAELENTRRRATIDADNLARGRAMSIALNFLPLVDAIRAAQKLDENDSGIASMARAADSALAQIGITKIETVGHLLNPTIHNAVAVVDNTDASTNTIVDEMQAGYMFGDTVMRPAMVAVAK